MLDQLFSFARDIKDKEISPLLKRILNLLFVSGIASKIFIVFYFDYQLINLLDYRSYYIFFINGDFFIPLTIFAIIWGGTIFIGYLFFSVPNFILNSKFTARILKFSLIESLSPKKIEDIDSRLDRIGISTISDHGIIALFEQIKSSFSIQDFSKINKNIAIVQANIEGGELTRAPVSRSQACLCELSDGAGLVSTRRDVSGWVTARSASP